VNHGLAYLAHDFARFYDWTHDGLEDDIPFYVTMARRYCGPALELACGTGRLTIPLARKGIRVTGIDISPEMLRIAEMKLSQEAAEVRDRVRLLQGDMRDFDLGEAANLAFIPAASFFHLHAECEQTSCLSCVHRHLSPRGALVADLIPAERMANQVVGETNTVRRGVCSATGKMTQELNRKLSIDESAQRVTVEHTYAEAESDGSEKRYVFVQDYTWVTEIQMRGLLRKAGFKDASIFGGYDFQPFGSESARMIFLAEK